MVSLFFIISLTTTRWTVSLSALTSTADLSHRLNRPFSFSSDWPSSSSSSPSSKHLVSSSSSSSSTSDWRLSGRQELRCFLGQLERRHTDCWCCFCVRLSHLGGQLGIGIRGRRGSERRHVALMRGAVTWRGAKHRGGDGFLGVRSVTPANTFLTVCDWRILFPIKCCCRREQIIEHETTGNRSPSRKQLKCTQMHFAKHK